MTHIETILSFIDLCLLYKRDVKEITMPQWMYATYCANVITSLEGDVKYADVDIKPGKEFRII